MCYRCAARDLDTNAFIRHSYSCNDLRSNNNFIDRNEADKLISSYSQDSFKVPVIQGNFEEQSVLVWRLPKHISQSRLAGRKRSSNACTIISLKIVECMHLNKVLFPTIEFESYPLIHLLKWHKKSLKTQTFPCPGRIMNCLVNAIVEGNDLHEQALMTRRTNRKNFTIPEALRATNYSFYEIDFCSVRGSICENLPRFLQFAIHNKVLSSQNQLFFLLIVFEQCVVIVYQRSDNLIGFLDSHLHSPNGAIIACTTMNNMDRFCTWLTSHIFSDVKYLELELQSFELSSVSCSKSKMSKSLNRIGANAAYSSLNLAKDYCTLSNYKQITKKNKKVQVFPKTSLKQLTTLKQRETAHQIIRQRRQAQFHHQLNTPNLLLVNKLHNGTNNNVLGLNKNSKISISLPHLL